MIGVQAGETLVCQWPEMLTTPSGVSFYILLLQLFQHGFNLSLGGGCDCPFRHKSPISTWQHQTTQHVKPLLHKQTIPSSVSWWGLYGRCALSIHLTQQHQVILLLHYTCIGPVIRALIHSLVDPGWWFFSCCEDLNLKFHFPSGQVWVLQSTCSVLLKHFPSPYVLFFEPERNYHCSFQIREPHISVPVALPRMSLVMLLLGRSSHWSGNGKGLKGKVIVICRTSEAERVGD